MSYQGGANVVIQVAKLWWNGNEAGTNNNYPQAALDVSRTCKISSTLGLQNGFTCEHSIKF